MKRFLLLGACVAALLPTGARCEWTLDASTTFAYDDNVSNSLEAEDRKADGSLAATVSGGIYETLGSSTSLGLNLIAEPATYLRYSGLDNLALGASARLRQKFGLGDAPSAVLSVQALHRDYHYDYRDGWQYDAGVSLGRQISERWSARAGVRYDRYSADRIQPAVLPGISTAAYDTSGWNFDVQSAFSLTPSDLLSLAYTWRKGTATAVTPPDEEVLEYSSAVARDPVFSSTTPLVAYRIQAKTDLLSLTWSHALGAHTALNLAYAYVRSRTESELGAYYSNLISISLTYSQ
jgi:hypothetical protein